MTKGATSGAAAAIKRWNARSTAATWRVAKSSEPSYIAFIACYSISRILP